MEAMYVKLHSTGSLCPEQRRIASELMSRYINRGELAKYKHLEFCFVFKNETLIRVELGSWRQGWNMQEFRVCEEWHYECGYMEHSFNWW